STTSFTMRASAATACAGFLVRVRCLKRSTPSRANTTAIRTMTTNTMSAASQTGIHEARPMIANAPSAGIAQNRTNSATRNHTPPLPTSLQAVLAHLIAESTSATTRLRTSSATSPSRVSSPSSQRSRKPRRVVMSVARRLLRITGGLLRGLLALVGCHLGTLGDVVGRILAGLDHRVELLAGSAGFADGLA